MIGRAKLDKEFFSAPPSLTPGFSAGNVQVQHKAGIYSIESLFTLKKLLAEKRAEKEDPILRFLVDKSGIAWFARETRPGNHAPKHYQMTGESINNAYCVTAGNIKFKNTSFTTLKSITHKSGDFHPSFHSLRLFLAILIVNEKMLPFKLPRILVVKEYDAQGKMRRKHRWPITQIKNWVTNFSTNQELINILTNQVTESKTVHYEAVNFTNNKIHEVQNNALSSPPNRRSMFKKLFYKLFF